MSSTSPPPMPASDAVTSERGTPAEPRGAAHAPVSMLDTGSAAIEIRGLCKSYRGRRAVDHLSMTVPRAGVHGFLGPNGSGKTTTIRMLLGLARAEEGSMRILDHEVPARLPEVLNRVGAIVEQPKFFPNFSARQNLQLAADMIGTPRAQVDHVLEQVGLLPRANDKFRTYSLGMKQRLAVAGTLLKSPDLLIFDEPTNGLDPAGIHEVRETIRGLGRSGHCVLVSSHILSEVQQMADTVSIIAGGRLLAEGPVAAIMGEQQATLRVTVADPDAALSVLKGAGFQPQRDESTILLPGTDDAAAVNQCLAQHNIFASQLVTTRPNLEAVFLGLTRGEAPPTHFDMGTVTPAQHGTHGGAR